MIHEVPSTSVRRTLGELLNVVQYRGDSVLITRDGKPVAAIVGMALFENLRSLKEELDWLCAELADLGAQSPEAASESGENPVEHQAHTVTRKRRARR
jgi:prevent-host-death family protein